jgi:hypothetical protein
MFHVYRQRTLLEKLDYMRVHPEKAGLAKRAEEWRWSSTQ